MKRETDLENLETIDTAIQRYIIMVAVIEMALGFNVDIDDERIIRSAARHLVALAYSRSFDKKAYADFFESMAKAYREMISQ